MLRTKGKKDFQFEKEKAKATKKLQIEINFNPEASSSDKKGDQKPDNESSTEEHSESQSHSSNKDFLMDLATGQHPAQPRAGPKPPKSIQRKYIQLPQGIEPLLEAKREQVLQKKLSGDIDEKTDHQVTITDIAECILVEEYTKAYEEIKKAPVVPFKIHTCDDFKESLPSYWSSLVSHLEAQIILVKELKDEESWDQFVALGTHAYKRVIKIAEEFSQIDRLTIIKERFEKLTTQRIDYYCSQVIMGTAA
mmetsp:Transcript_38991/g.59295  ORF Transcript_38991/g.59295 Transcript_38991/m.59295 type:complete len:251 (+) Transcript_38991:765-1517(+)